jgi:hypothetical protein
MAGSPGAWRGDLILFARDGASGPLYRISATGGTAAAVTALRDGESAHGWPAFLPAGDRFLYTVKSAAGTRTIQMASLDGADVREVLTDASHVVPADGYIVYLRDRALVVQPFDLDTLIPRGDPIHVSEGTPSDTDDGVRAFSLSGSGMLAYQVGPETDAPASVTLIDWRLH